MLSQLDILVLESSQVLSLDHLPSLPLLQTDLDDGVLEVDIGVDILFASLLYPL